MCGENDLKALKSFLRQQKIDAPINPAHKARLREELFAASAKPSFFRMHYLFAGSAAAVLILTFVIYPQLTTNIACTAIESANGNGTHAMDILTGKRYQPQQSMTMTLDDGSQLVFDPNSAFKVLSSTTNREKEDAVILLERGVLTADITPKRPHLFLVRTPDVEIEVIGTQFKVSVTEENTEHPGGE